MNTDLLRSVISTLNCIEVKGKDNLDHLLGCIQALESLVHSTEQYTTPVKEDVNG